MIVRCSSTSKVVCVRVAPVATPLAFMTSTMATDVSDHGASDTVPYREAILAVRKRAESAAKGNLPPAPPPEDPAPPADPLEVGKAVPDITAPGFSSP